MIRLFVSLILQFQIAAYAADNGVVQIFLGTTQQPPANEVKTNHLLLELVTPDGHLDLDVVAQHKQRITMWVMSLYNEIVQHQNRGMFQVIHVGGNDALLTDSSKDTLKQITHALYIQGVLD